MGLGALYPEKKAIPYTESGKMPDLGSGGLGAIFIVHVKKRVTQKLHTIILLHFGLATSGFILGQPENLSCS